GLTDGVGNLHGVLREKFGEKVKLQPVKVSRGWLQKRFGVSQGGEIASDVLATIEERAVWSRYGL
ncbi:MAG: S49 family peptidase, partial [Alphaproteobacteria bacterium]|nr:S49 family peptidase [Alphaproteobacteria bacterium]